MSTITRVGCIDIKLFYDIYIKHVGKCRKKISDNAEHLLNGQYTLLPSGIRLSSLQCRTNRFKKSFVPVSIRQYNDVNIDI